MKKNSNAILIKSLGHIKFLKCLKKCDGIMGNSSSGIIEAPLLKIASLNIGDRQKGRIMGPSIFNCRSIKKEIIKSLDLAFQYDKTAHWDHPYGQGNTSEQIMKVLIKVGIPSEPKKEFYDL